MPDVTAMKISDFGVTGLTPAGIAARIRDVSPDLSIGSGFSVVPWKYGSRINCTPEKSAEYLRRLREVFVPFISENLDNPAAGLVGSAAESGLTLVFAESCTGGMTGELVTALAGSSAVFWGSLVTYANEAKERILGVDTLKEYGAVSEETVRAMSAGALRVSGADAAAAISGVAGPGGGTEYRPVGTVWFSFAGRASSSTLCCRFSGDREDVRRKAAAVALAGCANQITGTLLDTSWIGEYTFY